MLIAVAFLFCATTFGAVKVYQVVKTKNIRNLIPLEKYPLLSVDPILIERYGSNAVISAFERDTCKVGGGDHCTWRLTKVFQDTLLVNHSGTIEVVIPPSVEKSMIEVYSITLIDYILWVLAFLSPLLYVLIKKRFGKSYGIFYLTGCAGMVYGLLLQHWETFGVNIAILAITCVIILIIVQTADTKEFKKEMSA